MSAAPNDTNRDARTRIAHAIVTAAERGHTLILEDLEEQGSHYQACVDLLRDAGAEEQAARAKLAWRLDRPHRRAGGSMQP